MTAAEASTAGPARPRTSRLAARPRTAPPSPGGPPDLACRPAQSPEELAAHFSVRHDVFVLEQAVFASSDRDEHDEDGRAIHLVGYCDGVVAGGVRLYELDPSTGLWQGDRLAVLPSFRIRGLGAPLVRCAVAVAGAHGGRDMVAHIQVANVTFFTRLGWEPVGEPETYVGLPHQQMRIPLPPPDVGRSLARAFAAAGPA